MIINSYFIFLSCYFGRFPLWCSKVTDL